MEFDFVAHRLAIRTAAGAERAVDAGAQVGRGLPCRDDGGAGVAGHRAADLDAARRGARRRARSRTTTVPPTTPRRCERWWRALLAIERVIQRYRTPFSGKSSPVLFFWGGFDLAHAALQRPPRTARAGHRPDPGLRGGARRTWRSASGPAAASFPAAALRLRAPGARAASPTCRSSPRPRAGSRHSASSCSPTPTRWRPATRPPRSAVLPERLRARRAPGRLGPRRAGGRRAGTRLVTGTRLRLETDRVRDRIERGDPSGRCRRPSRRRSGFT